MCFCWSTHSLAYKSVIKINIEFEWCIDFLVRMIDKYGEEVLRELEEEKQNKEEKEAALSVFSHLFIVYCFKLFYTRTEWNHP